MKPTPTPHRLAQRDARVAWHPYTQHALDHDPLPVAEAHGSILVLEDGRELIDAISSWWAVLHGHGHPALIEALQRQARRLDHVLFAGCTHEPAVGLAEDLIACAPHGLTRVFYSDDGSTAVEVALKIVLGSWAMRGEPGRRVLAAFEGAYHGDTFGAMAVGERVPFFATFEPLLFEVAKVALRPGALAGVLRELGPRAAGVIVEPLVQGASGMRMHAVSFLREVRATCDEFGLPLIADEVMTGFGRTGELFACAKAGVAPDVMCLAKALSGGMFPLAATLCSERLFADFLSPDRRRTFFHGHTFTAHPIGCAVARASLAMCRSEAVPTRLDRIGARIEAALSPLRSHARVAELRRTGGIVALELRLPGHAGYLSELAPRLRAAAIDCGVLLRPLGNVLYAMPPASTSDAQCDRIAEVMEQLVREVE